MVKNVRKYIIKVDNLEKQLSLYNELNSPFIIKEVKGPEKEMKLDELIYESLTILRYREKNNS